MNTTPECFTYLKSYYWLPYNSEALLCLLSITANAALNTHLHAPSISPPPSKASHLHGIPHIKTSPHEHLHYQATETNLMWELCISNLHLCLSPLSKKWGTCTQLTAMKRINLMWEKTNQQSVHNVSPPLPKKRKQCIPVLLLTWQQVKAWCENALLFKLKLYLSPLNINQPIPDDQFTFPSICLP
jgi:hypothetical protein